MIRWSCNLAMFSEISFGFDASGCMLGVWGGLRFRVHVYSCAMRIASGSMDWESRFQGCRRWDIRFQGFRVELHLWMFWKS